MQCAREGQRAASLRTSECSAHCVSTPPTDDVVIVTSILKGDTVLDQEGISTLAAHLRSCCPRHVGPAELAATLQAAEVLVQGNQVKAMVGCGLSHWLMDIVEELAAMETDMLDHVVALLTRAISVLLVALAQGELSE